MEKQGSTTAKAPASLVRARGFALVVTLTLLILLTLLALGLLTLSGISLRSSNQGEAMQTARANARLALMLAIGDLQKQLGPDTRITMSADQITASDPSVSTTPQAQRHWCGAYKSWPAGLPADPRPTPAFLQWFVSGAPDKLTNKSYAGTAVSGKTVDLVTANTVGADGDTVRVPLVSQSTASGMSNNFGWWVGDLGAKGLIGAAKPIPTAVAEVRTDQQISPACGIKTALSGTAKPFDKLSPTDPQLAKVASWQSAGLLADKPQNIRGLFHDLTAYNRGLLTNVRTGGFRKDLSLHLEKTVGNGPTTPLYMVAGKTGINLEELWGYYNLYKELRTGSLTYTSGGSIGSNTRYLSLADSPTATVSDNFFYYKQPVIISYQLAFSFQTQQVTSGTQTLNRLRLVVDPILTYWNPLDVPVSIPTTSFNSIKYWQLPYDIQITSGARKFTVSIDKLLGGTTDQVITLLVGKSQQVVLKPGEVMKFSETAQTPITPYNPGLNYFEAKAGFNYGGGVAFYMRDQSNNYVDLDGGASFTYEVTPNSRTSGGPNGNSHTRHFSITHHELYVGEDRKERGDSLGYGNISIDWDFGSERLEPNPTLRQTYAPGNKPDASRMLAVDHQDVFGQITLAQGRSLPGLITQKAPFMLFSFNAKTEKGSARGGKFLARFNPKAFHVDFYDLSARELDILPYEIRMEPLNGWKDSKNLEVTQNGDAFFGGAMNAMDGTSFVVTHSVPREPLYSLAALQHSLANGFPTQHPWQEYATLNAREPMLPQISHAIGNSFAPSVIAPDKTEDSLPGPRPLADHSYLANQALWDDWYFSGIAPQTVASYNTKRDQRKVAEDFLNGTTPLPVIRFIPRLGSKTTAQALSTLFSGSVPATSGYTLTAPLIEVNGMFNVNSTSVEAWKSVLGALRARPIIACDSNGTERTASITDATPVAGLGTPYDILATGKGTVGVNDPAQWTGHRTLSDDEIKNLATAIVAEVRKRGPFLSLADFVNRRVGKDATLARAGAIQSALEQLKTVTTNEAYLKSDRAVDPSAAARYAFKEAETGAAAQGIPGIVKQADLLTPIAPILTARSDSFLIRAYGDKTDTAGNVIARAWCEAVVQRTAEFVDPTDAPEKSYDSIRPINKTFGRRFQIISFRWLGPSET